MSEPFHLWCTPKMTFPRNGIGSPNCICLQKASPSDASISMRMANRYVSVNLSRESLRQIATAMLAVADELEG